MGKPVKNIVTQCKAQYPHTYQQTMMEPLTEFDHVLQVHINKVLSSIPLPTQRLSIDKVATIVDGEVSEKQFEQLLHTGPIQVKVLRIASSRQDLVLVIPRQEHDWGSTVIRVHGSGDGGFAGFKWDQLSCATTNTQTQTQKLETQKIEI
jgi:hypothetical protein